VSSSSNSDLNPLAAEFKPRSGSFVPPLPPLAPQSPYKLYKTDDKGFGLFATTEIPRGTLIICEEPLLRISGPKTYLAFNTYCRLGNAEKATYDLLHSFKPAHLDLEQVSRLYLIDHHDTSMDDEDVEEAVAEHIRVMSIFSANNIALPNNHFAVFAATSRLNHSCVPNVHHSFNPVLNKLTVHAVADIKPEEELFITYLGGRGAYQLQEQRNQILQENYGFTCQCRACTTDIAMSDGRRELLGSIAWGLDQFRDGVNPTNAFIPASHATALKQTEDLVTVLLQEGILGMELAKAYHTASMHALTAKDYDKAVEYARDELEIERNCVGSEVADLWRIGAAAGGWLQHVLVQIKHEAPDEMKKKYASDIGFQDVPTQGGGKKGQHDGQRPPQRKKYKRRYHHNGGNVQSARDG
jgi:hypothetical protein